MVNASIKIQKINENTSDSLLNIQDDIRLYNKIHTSAVTIERFLQLLPIAFALHDIGNITKSSRLSWQQETPLLDYADTFQLEVGAAEKRSADIAEHMLSHMFPEISREDQQLVHHIIIQTIFNPQQTTSDEPFWLLVQTIDQIGSYFFYDLPYHQGTAGYLNEIYAASDVGQRAPFSLVQFLNFLPRRVNALFPDSLKQKETLKIFTEDENYHSLLHAVQAPDRPINYSQDIQDIFLGKYL